MAIQHARVAVALKGIDDLFFRLSGYRWKQITFDHIVEHLYRPTDPSSLGVSRMLFGFLMLVDGAEERGGAELDLRWGDPRTCHFPLLPLPALSLPYMALVYAVMWLGALGIALGYKYRTSAMMFVFPYWYILLRDKSYWNNHSYLFGLLGALLAGTQANNYLSLDAYYDKSKSGRPVPYWNYFIIKYQLFILYFIAGLKKSDMEWLSGYAMTSLSKHWVFDPFKIFLSAESIDYLIVHWFGFVFDLTVCFWMMREYTRPVAMVFCSMFHLMNSRLFSIGMFPWVCLVTMPLFCSPNWPRSALGAMKEAFVHCRTFCREFISILMLKACDPVDEPEMSCDKKEREVGQTQEDINDSNEGNGDAERSRSSKDTITFNREPSQLGDEDVSGGGEGKRDDAAEKTGGNKNKKSWKKRIVVGLLMAYMGLQAFLPYSHFVTKGFNNWTNGLYGYSWDMMVHTWDSILVLVKIVDNESKFEVFLDPEAWAPNQRWSKHGDMMHQYARCLRRNLIDSEDRKHRSEDYNPMANKRNNAKCHNTACGPSYFEEENNETIENIRSTNISIFIDVWCSLNGRFQQRMFNPNVDLLKVEWSPFKKVEWLLPLLTELNDWRRTMADIQKHVFSWNNYSDVLFVADFPGLYLENYVTLDLSNVSLTVLEGQVFYERVNRRKRFPNHIPGRSRAVHLMKGDIILVNPGSFHRIHTVGSSPACYMFTFTNITLRIMEANRGIEDDAAQKTRPKLPLMGEFVGKLISIGYFWQHVGNALLHVIYGVPMPSR